MIKLYEVLWHITPTWLCWSLNHLLATVHTWYLKVWPYSKETARHEANKVTQCPSNLVC